MVLSEWHTSPSRSTSVCIFTNSAMFPFAIQSDTITSRFLVIVAPSSGSTFGWWRDLHPMTSLQNLYEARSAAGVRGGSRRTCLRSPCKITRGARNSGQNIHDIALTLPRVQKFIVQQRVLLWVVTKRYFQLSRKQGSVATNPV